MLSAIKKIIPVKVKQSIKDILIKKTEINANLPVEMEERMIETPEPKVIELEEKIDESIIPQAMSRKVHEFGKKYPIINYREHPGFRDIQSKTSFTITQETEFEREVNAIDRLYAIIKDEPVTRGQVLGILQEVSKRVGNIKKLYLKYSKSIFASFLFTNSLSNAEGQIVYYSLLNHNRHSYKQKEIQYISRLEELKKNGFSILDIPNEIKLDLRTKAKPYIDKLRKMAGDSPKGRTVLNVDFTDDFGIALQDFVKKFQIAEIHSNYIKNDVFFFGCGFEFTTNKHLWWNGCYADKGVPDSPLTYLHCDYGDYMPKMMLYLTDVEESNGPTHFVPESNNWDRSEFLFQFHKGLDRVSYTHLSAVNQENYYRFLYKNPETRGALLNFPTEFIGSSHFGDDLTLENPQTATIMKNEIKLLKSVGDSIIFDGGRGLHRGSIASQGERAACQLVFSPTSNTKIDSEVSKILGRPFSVVEW